MISRHAETLIRDRLATSPAVVLVGPRQAGKTTLARSMGGRYFDLEQESTRVGLDAAWGEVMVTSLAEGPVVLDEAQSWPELFPRLRGAIDERPDHTGRFLLLGSVSPALMRDVAESLAGRLAIVELTPFLRGEVADVALDELWLEGGYPAGGIISEGRFPHWQRDYLALLAQRDLPSWGLSARPQVTDRLMRMLAVAHGQPWNASQLGSSLGISYPTVNSYLDHLEGAFLVRRLPPFFANLKKRLVKRPRVYWRDSGLLHALLQTSTWDELLSRPWLGQSWEGFVIDQILGALGARGEAVNASFFRTSDGQEIDLVLERGGRTEAVEIKLTSNPSTGDMERLDRAADLIGVDRRVLISRSEETAEDGRHLSCSLEHYLDSLGRP